MKFNINLDGLTTEMCKLALNSNPHMDIKNIRKEYTNGELTVVWQPAKCIHSEVCVKTLPHVYNPKEKPWIRVQEATTKDLKAQIDRCPSGALTYFLNGQESSTSSDQLKNTKIKVIPDGPLLVEGDLEVTLKDGSTAKHENITAFCRCGASSNKPYCDGSHVSIGFNDS